MGDVVGNQGIFANGDIFYRSKTLIGGVLEEIADALYKGSVDKNLFPIPGLVMVDNILLIKPWYNSQNREVQVSKSYFSRVEEIIKENEKKARDEVEFVFGKVYGRHIFSVFTGDGRINEVNQDLYKRFIDIFATWFRDSIYTSNPHVIENTGDLGQLEDETRRKLTKKVTQDGYLELFSSLETYFFETFLEDAENFPNQPVEPPKPRKV
ncbi:hypothetical protein J4458_02300 [Candidatus Woesearchaeota archaeon]|nr:hypothetical protein [Candidatus Woesearchaeota archaeon]